MDSQSCHNEKDLDSFNSNEESLTDLQEQIDPMSDIDVNSSISQLDSKSSNGDSCWNLKEDDLKLELDSQIEAESDVPEMNSQCNREYVAEDILNFQEQCSSSELELSNPAYNVEVQSNCSELRSPTSNEIDSLNSQELASESDCNPQAEVENKISKTNSQPRNVVSVTDILNLYDKCLSDLEMFLNIDSNVIQSSLRKLRTRTSNPNLNLQGSTLKSNICSQHSQAEDESNVPDAKSDCKVGADALSLYEQCFSDLKLFNFPSNIEDQNYFSELRSETNDRTAGLNLQDETSKSNRLSSNSPVVEATYQEVNSQDIDESTGLDSQNFYAECITELQERLNRASDIQVVQDTYGLDFQGNSSIGRNSFNLFESDNQNGYEYPYNSNGFQQNIVASHIPFNFIHNLPTYGVQYQLIDWNPMNFRGILSPEMYSVVPHTRNLASVYGTDTQITWMNASSSELQPDYTFDSSGSPFSSNWVAQNTVPIYDIQNFEQLSPSYYAEQHLEHWDPVNSENLVTAYDVNFVSDPGTSTPTTQVNRSEIQSANVVQAYYSSDSQFNPEYRSNM